MILNESEIRKLIVKYNEEEVKNIKADPNELILVDNRITRTIKMHRGNIVAAIVSGHWGSGKTKSALKLFHDLKNSIYVTYVPTRYVVDKLQAKTRIERGTSSIVATLIAKALTHPQELSKSVQGVMTNANDIKLSVNGKLSDIIEQYYLHLREEDAEYLLLIDELENAIRQPDDIDAISEAISTLRRLFDYYGSMRLTIILFASTFTPGSKPYEVTKGSKRLSEAIKSRLQHMYGEEAMYILDKVVFTDIDRPEITKEILKGILDRSLSLISKKFGINVNLYNKDAAVEFIVKASRWVRFGRDILVDAIARAVISSINEGANSIDLKEVARNVVKEVLGLDVDPEKVLLKGKLSLVNIDMRHVEGIINSILKQLQIEGLADFYKVEERIESGFTSFTYIARRVQRNRVVEIPITFWLRFTDITTRGINKANRLFSNRKVLMITTEICKHGRLTSSRKEFDLMGVIPLPSELAYYIIAGSRILDSKVLDSLKKRFEEEYVPMILDFLRKALS